MRPTVVHCSAGIARTGVFCALAVTLKSMEEDMKMDLVSLSKHLRTQRTSMIQTADQYAFIYLCVIGNINIILQLWTTVF